MGSFGDNDKKIESIENNSDADLSDFDDTQPVDDEFSLLSGDKSDDFQYLQSTVPDDEFFPFGDAFETQMVDLCGETQVAELCGETQLVDLSTHHAQVDELCGETQQVDLGVHAQVEDFCGETEPVDLGAHAQVGELFGETQVLDVCGTEISVDSDDEEVCETEVYCDTQVISIEDTAQRGANFSVDTGNISSPGLNKQSEEDSKAELAALSNREHSSGRGFTSIRAASIRASGFAAKKSAPKRNNKNSCSIGNSSLEKRNPEKDEVCVSSKSLKLENECNLSGQEDRTIDMRDLLESENDCNHTREEYDQQIESRNVNSRKIRSSTARKLFMDDDANDIERADGGVQDANNTVLPLLFASDNGSGGLSYVDSQEPGELSQANALDVVDKIVKLNIIESVETVAFKGCSDGKSKPISSAKGTQNLAKKATSRIREEENGAFIWDDNLEDEGGGKFFEKKKELFFDKVSQRHTLKSSRKSWSLNSSNGVTLKENGNKEEKVKNNRKSKDAVFSDSRLLSKSLSLNGKSCELTEASFKRNIMKELDEETNAASGDMHADDGSDKDAPDMLDVGLDTQMAADAMEALQFAVSLTDNDGNQGAKKGRKSSCDKKGSKSKLGPSLYQKEACSSGVGVITRRTQKAMVAAGSHRELSVPPCRPPKLSRKKMRTDEKREAKRSKLDLKDFVENVSENVHNVSRMVGQSKEDNGDGNCATASGDPRLLKKLPVQDQHDSLTPVAYRTRGSVQISHLKSENNLNSSRGHIDVIGHVSQRKRSRTKAFTSETPAVKADQAGRLRNMNNRQLEQSEPIFVDYPRGRRTRTQFRLAGQEETTICHERPKRSKLDDTRSPSTRNKVLKEQLDACGRKSVQTSVDRNASGIQEAVIQAKASKHSIVKRSKDNNRCAEGDKRNSCAEASSKDGCKPSALESTTLVCCATPVNDASPICKGDEYHKQSCRKNLLKTSLRKEINSLLTTGTGPTCSLKDSRRRRDMANVRVLFSHHLDADIIKQQKKILNRLGASIASSMSDASHFVTDEFARTRNMLEAIAFGKPVVTHLWLESCGQAGCFIDERSYILRDARKEKEFGFTMPASLARASQHPLLQGQRVLITRNTKPGKDILASLVKAVHGLAVERLGRSSLKDESFPDDILVISCEEDYEVCVPFLEKGATIYSSELLLNGIVTQRLEYERHQLFTDNVKRTRSTIWLKRNSNVYAPVSKTK